MYCKLCYVTCILRFLAYTCRYSFMSTVIILAYALNYFTIWFFLKIKLKNVFVRGSNRTILINVQKMLAKSRLFFTWTSWRRPKTRKLFKHWASSFLVGIGEAVCDLCGLLVIDSSLLCCGWRSSHSSAAWHIA